MISPKDLIIAAICVLYLAILTSVLAFANQDNSKAVQNPAEKATEHRHRFYEFNCTEKEAKKAADYIGECFADGRLYPFVCINNGVRNNCTLECYGD